MRNKPQERKTSSLLHRSEPDGRRTGHSGNPVRSYDTKIQAIQEYLETPYKYSILCNLKFGQEKGLQSHQTHSHAVVLYNTLLAACIEKAGCIQTKGEPYQKCRLTARMPRVVLKSKSVYKIYNGKKQDHIVLLFKRRVRNHV